MRATGWSSIRNVSLIAGAGLAVLVSNQLIGCSSDSNPSTHSPVGSSAADTGSVGMALTLPGGEILSTASWVITGPNGASTVVQQGSVNLQNSQKLSFTVGGILAGSNYNVAVSSTSVDGTANCSGSAAFSVTAGTTTNVTVLMQCTSTAPDAGSAAINGQTYSCATASGVSVSPSETTIGNSVGLIATAVAPNLPGVTFAWSAPSGTFSSSTSATTSFTCTTTGTIPVSVTVSDGTLPDGGSCNPLLTTATVQVQCDLVPGAPTACALGAGGAIKHVIYVQFDNTHLYRDSYGRPQLPNNVPSDLEQMPHLLNFIRNNGTMMANDHTILISHTAGGILTSLTGVYPDRHGQTVSNSYERTTSTGGFTFPSSFQYWTDPAYSNTTIPNMVTPTGANAPAPWASFTRAGCNVGGVGVANMEIENNNDYSNGDIAEIFGTSSAAYQEAATAWNAPYPTAASTISATDFEGIAIHCASGNSVCAAGEPDLLPGEPGGYTGFNGLFGTKQINPLLLGQDGGTPLPDGGVAVTDLLGKAITDPYGQPGFPGFDGMSAAVSLSYVANMQEHGVPVTYAYISDVHDNHGVDGTNAVAVWPGRRRVHRAAAGLRPGVRELLQPPVRRRDQLEQHAVRLYGGRGRPLRRRQCRRRRTATAATPRASGRTARSARSISTSTRLMNNEFPSVASQFVAQNGLNAGAPNAYTVHGDDAPPFYLSRTSASAGPVGALSQTDPNTRTFERAVAQATASNPFTGSTDSLLYRMLDQTGMRPST